MKDVVVRVRMTGEEKAILMEGAGRAGMTLSGFVLSRCLEGAPVASPAKRGVVSPDVSVSFPPSAKALMTKTRFFADEPKPFVVPVNGSSGLDFSKCAHPRLQCVAEGRAICGVCREVNDEPE